MAAAGERGGRCRYSVVRASPVFAVISAIVLPLSLSRAACSSLSGFTNEGRPVFRLDLLRLRPVLKTKDFKNSLIRESWCLRRAAAQGCDFQS